MRDTSWREANLTVIVVNVGRAFLEGWLLMITVGVAHSHWWPAVPTLGYWWAVLIMAFLPENTAFRLRHYWANRDADRRGRR